MDRRVHFLGRNEKPYEPLTIWGVKGEHGERQPKNQDGARQRYMDADEIVLRRRT